MRKKIFSLLPVLVLAILLPAAWAAASSLTVPQQTGSPVPSVVDQAGLLNDKQKQQLSAQIGQVERSHGVRIAVVTLQTLQGKEPRQTADAILDRDYADGAHGSMVLLLAMDTRDWYVSTDNSMRKRITDDGGFAYLSDAFLPSLKDGDYAGAFRQYVATADAMLDYYEEQGEPYDPASEFSLLAFIVAVVLAGLAAIGVWQILLCQLNNVTRAVAADSYLQRDSVALTEQSDTYLYTDVTRTPKAKSSSGSSSSGGSHGGGGGKF